MRYISLIIMVKNKEFHNCWDATENLFQGKNKNNLWKQMLDRITKGCQAGKESSYLGEADSIVKISPPS